MVRSLVCNHTFKVMMAILGVASLSACSRQEEITTYEEPTSETEGLGRGFTAKAAPTATPAATNLTYKTPEGWLPGQVGGMRKAAFHVERDGKKIDITAIDLASAAGALLPNINRWRGQIQLGEISQEEMAKSIEEIQVADVGGHYIELIGPEDAELRQAILGVVAVRGREAWFFKLWGDADLAMQEKERFLSLVKSVEFESPARTRTPASASKRSKPVLAGSSVLQYSTPDSWTPARVGGMRKAAFGITEGDKSMEMTVIDLSLTAGELLPNVNRWRDQIKLKSITQEQLVTQLSPIEIDGEKGHFMELIGPKDADRPLAILGVILLRQDRSWFFKMIGDADLVTRERERFEEFVKSVKFAVDGDSND